MLTNDPRKMDAGAWLAIGVGVALAAGGCAGTTEFTDTRPIAVLGMAPPPPPEPPPKPERVVITEDQIQINEKIQFDFDKATIKPESHDLLNEVAEVIAKNPQIKALSIEGHTDSDGKEDYNQKLSERRAASVREYLTTHGIDAGMLQSAGFGESKPLAGNDTDDGKEKNRRVEFMITKQEEVKKVYEVDPKTGERRLIKEGDSQTAQAGEAP